MPGGALKKRGRTRRRGVDIGLLLCPHTLDDDHHHHPSQKKNPELKQAKAHERPPAALKLARFLPKKLRAKLLAGRDGPAAEPAGEAGGGRYARAPAGPSFSDPDKRE